MLAAAFFCLVGSMPVMAVSNAARAKNAYISWLNKTIVRGSMPTKYEIIDLDKNGIPELFVTGQLYDSHVYTYDIKKKKMVRLIKCQLGKPHFGITYNKSKKMFTVMSGSTGDTIIRFYKLKGKKVKRVSLYEFYFEKHWRKNYQNYFIVEKYFINHKKVKEATFMKKYKKATKGFRELRYTIGSR